MRLFNFNKKEEIEKKIEPFEFTFGENQSFSLKYDYTDPLITEYKGSNGYIFGPYNLHPQELNRAYYSSTLHQAIVEFKTLCSFGNGYEIIDNNLDINGKIALNQLLNQFENQFESIGRDLIIHGRIFNKIQTSDTGKIIKCERLPSETIRIAEVDEYMKPKSYFYSYDWRQITRFPKKLLNKFEENSKGCIGIYSYDLDTPNKLLYSLPTYTSALNWIVLDGEIPNYQRSNIQNSINPSILMEFFRPATAEQKRQFKDDFNKSYSGANNAGKMLAIWNDSTENATKITQMEPNKLDKTFLQSIDTIERKICYSHGLDPQLLGLKTPGALGNSQDLFQSMEVFLYTQIYPLQRKLENYFNYLISINNIPAKIKFNSPNLYKNKN